MAVSYKEITVWDEKMTDSGIEMTVVGRKTTASGKNMADFGRKEKPRKQRIDKIHTKP